MVAAADLDLPIDDLELGGKPELNFKVLTDLRRQDADGQEHLVDLCAQILEQSCLINDAKTNGACPKHPTVFHGQRSPNITPRQYIERIATYSGCSPCCIVLGMKYLEKLRNKDAAYELTSLNFHRLLLTAVLIAAKFVDDFYYSNGYWAKVGGVPVGELNGMETEFLFLMSFNLHVKRAEYDQFVAELFIRLEDSRLINGIGGLNLGASPTSAVLWEGLEANPPSLQMGNGVYSKQAQANGVMLGQDTQGNQMQMRSAVQSSGGCQGLLIPIHHPHQGVLGTHQQQHGVAPVPVPASQPLQQPMSVPLVRGVGVPIQRPVRVSGQMSPSHAVRSKQSGPGPLQKSHSAPLNMPHSSYTGLALEC